MARFLTDLANPDLVASFQKLCGVEFVQECAVGESSINNDKNVGGGISHTHHNVDASLCHRPVTAATTINNNNYDKSSCLGNNVSGTVSNGGYQHGNNHSTQRNSVQNCDSEDHCLNSTIQNHPTRQKKSSAVNGVIHNGRVRVSSFDCAANSHTSPTVHEGVGKSATRVSVRYPVLYYWARVGAFLGNEEFYLTGLPYLMWTVDSAMIRQTAVVWWLVMYLGQAGKDYMCWPRPPSPPVVRLETTHLAECSMPSTHAMAGTAIPLLLATLLLERYQLSSIPVLCMAVLWCFTTCLSRLYLGVHTVLDILSGCLISLVAYVLVFPLSAGYDLCQQTHPLAPLVLVFTSLALCTVCYPSRPSKNSAKFDAITTTAVVVGVGIGSWLNYQLGYSMDIPPPVHQPVSAPTLSWLVMSLLQFVVGVGLVYGIKMVMKRLTISFFSFFFFGLDRLDAQHPGVMVGYTYTTYLSLGLTITFLCPLLFTFLGFGRPGYYLEVL